WVEPMYRQLGQSRKGRITAQQRIAAIAKELDVDAGALAKCQAIRANASLDWLTAAHQAGIQVSPSVVIGGRIYAALIDPSTLQGLVEAELAPGISDALHEHLGRWPR
ncbi:MAG: hypothetical protein NT062_21450, partial [Proteobacteria bacterium]|nr:hypothetical protein [Pseudomonadota bacterium]